MARAKANFQHVIGWLNLEQADCPIDPFEIDAEEKSCEPTEESGRLTKLLCQAVPQSHRTTPPSM
jgi:hypothetical protein